MIDAVGLAGLAEEQAEQALEDGTYPYHATSEEVTKWLDDMRAGRVNPLPYPLLPLEHLEEITGKKWDVVGHSIFHDITGRDLHDADGPASGIISLLEQVVELLDENGGSGWLILHDAYQFQGYTSVLNRIE